MPSYERINIVVSLTLIGLALYFVLDFPTQSITFTLFESPIKIVAPRQWLMMILLGGMAMTGASAVIKAHPNLNTQRASYLLTFWMLPGLLVVLATQTLGLAPTPVVWAVGLAVVGVLLWVTIYAEYLQVQTATRLGPRLWRQLMGYAIALTFYIVIYQTRSRSAVSATIILLISSMVALGLLRHSPTQTGKTWLYAAIVGLSIGQTTWALNYWRTGALNAGLLLLLILYLLVGMAQQHLQGTLSRRTLWEFGAVASVGLVVIFSV